MIDNSTYEDIFDKVRKSNDTISKALDMLMNNLFKIDANGLKDIIDKKEKNLYESVAQAEYNITLLENFKPILVGVIETIKEAESKGKIKKEDAEKEIGEYENKITELYFVMADFKKLQRKVEFMRDFISWKYDTLLSESMEKVAKTNNKLAAIAVGIALASFIISLVALAI